MPRGTGAGPIWPAEEITRLRKLTAEGASAAQIGTLLGRSRNAIIGKWHRLGVDVPGRRRVWNPLAVQKLTQRWIGGYTATQIADELGMSAIAVSSKIGEMRKKNSEIPKRKAGGYRPPRHPRTRLEIVEKIVVGPNKRHSSKPGTVLLIDLTADKCHFIPGEVQGGRTLYCGGEAIPGLPYCLEHARMCYQMPRTYAQRISAWANLVEAKRAKREKQTEEIIRSAAALSPDGAAA